jgi:hypothetical protein
MHVIGNNRPAGFGQSTADGPVVAAIELWLAHLVGRRRFASKPANRVDLFGGPRQHAARLAHQWRVPAGPLWIQPRIDLGRQYAVRKPAAHIPYRSGIVQQREHRIDDENGIFGPPRPRIAPEQEVFERFYRQACDAGVDAVRVSLQELTFANAQSCQALACARAKPVESVAPVDVEGDAPEQLGQLPGRPAPDQVHLEEPVLAVRVARGEGEVCPRIGGDRRDSGRVSFDKNAGVYTRDDVLAIEVGQARPQHQVSQAESDDENEDCAGQNSADSASEHAYFSATTLRIFIAFVLPDTPSRSPFVKMTRSPISTRSLESSTSKISA